MFYYGVTLTRAYSCKRPALFTTTLIFEISRRSLTRASTIFDSETSTIPIVDRCQTQLRRSEIWNRDSLFHYPILHVSTNNTNNNNNNNNNNPPFTHDLVKSSKCAFGVTFTLKTENCALLIMVYVHKLPHSPNNFCCGISYEGKNLGKKKHAARNHNSHYKYMTLKYY